MRVARPELWDRMSDDERMAYARGVLDTAADVAALVGEVCQVGGDLGAALAQRWRAIQTEFETRGLPMTVDALLASWAVNR